MTTPIQTARKRRYAVTRLLYRITRELHDPQQDFQAALQAAVGHLAHYGFLRPTIALYDISKDEIRFELSHGLSDVERKRGRFRKGEGIEGKVFAGGQTAVVPSIASEPDFIDRSGARRRIDRRKTAFICTPIGAAHADPVGTISVDVVGGDEETLKWDRRLLTTVAHLVSASARIWRDQLEEDVAYNEEHALLSSVHLQQTQSLVGNSHPMRALFQLMLQVSPSDLTVLIRGESGTGKEMIARAIHGQSGRATAPFVSVNCGALPENLVESELFGHVRGAFTGAVHDRKGRFELANGGSLFLDEIGDLPLPLQVKLLRVLQEGEIHRVGEETSRRVDVRVIAATHADLELMIEETRFREDLFYRLNVFPVYVPALRERRTDITLLADHFVDKHIRQQGKDVARISTSAIDLMCAYHWPGNVRELENCVERAVLLARDGVIRDHHLPPTLQTGRSSGTTKQGSLESTVMAFEREILVEAMKNARGNIAAAARDLASTPRILAYRLKKHGLHDSLASRRRGT